MQQSDNDNDNEQLRQHISAYLYTPLTEKRKEQIDKMTYSGLCRIVSNPKTYAERNYAFAIGLQRQLSDKK